MQLQPDLLARTTWIAAGGLCGALIPLIVLLMVDQLPLAIIATVIGIVLGYALWMAAHKGIVEGV